jgi:hypothetical protein
MTEAEDIERTAQIETELKAPFDVSGLAAVGARVDAAGRWAVGWANRKFDELTVDTAGLSDGHRRLTIVGYVATIGLLVAILLSDLVSQSQLPFEDYRGIHHVPIILIGLFGATFVVGWAFVLTGASDAGRRVFLPVLLVCALQASSIVPANIKGPLVLAFLAVGLVAGVWGPTDMWQRHPIIEFLVWMVVLATAIGSNVVEGIDPSARLRSLYDTASTFALLAFPFWLRLGRDSAQAAIELGRKSTTLLTRSLAGRPFLLFVLAVTVAWQGTIFFLGASLVEVNPALGGWLVLSFLMAYPVCL